MNVKNFVIESIDEMKNKVTWPSYSFLQNSAVLVLVASLIFALVIGVIDLGFDLF
ncbi:preprotein translocase subunit SecE [Algoriphagus sp.]|uniref:preprotein translocase subunit SecE n=1 Tax=Algoriphagus sp. TaxID=1872435 RepID=UPI00391DF171